MTQLATLQEQLEALNEAITSGATTVSFDGKSVTYRSLNDMLRIRNDLERQISGKSVVRRVLVNSKKGL